VVNLTGCKSPLVSASGVLNSSVGITGGATWRDKRSAANCRVRVIANASLGRGANLSVTTRGARVQAVDAIERLIEFDIEDRQIPFVLEDARVGTFHKGFVHDSRPLRRNQYG